MYSNEPVPVPDIPGRIFFRKYHETRYVQLKVGNKYNRERKYNEPIRKTIGIQLEHMPSLMLPNENYELYLSEEGRPMEQPFNSDESEFIQNRKTYIQYADFFNELYFEIKQQSRRNLDRVMTPYQVESLNRILLPLKEMMQGEEYADCLSLIRIPDGDEHGMTYGDVMILMTQYKTALAKYKSKKI